MWAGLTKTHLTTIPVSSLEKNAECPICQVEYETSEDGVQEKAVTVNACNHVFGQICLANHIVVKGPLGVTCPLCRATLFDTQLSCRAQELMLQFRTIELKTVIDRSFVLLHEIFGSTVAQTAPLQQDKDEMKVIFDTTPGQLLDHAIHGKLQRLGYWESEWCVDSCCPGSSNQTTRRQSF